MKRGLFYPHRRRLLAALALPAVAAFLLYSCDPPASPLRASPNSAVPSAPPPAALEVTRISGLPNMAEIERRLNAQYAESAESTEGVEFDLSSTSGTTVIASITYAEGKLLPMTIGGTEHQIKTVTITRVVDGKTIPTTVEYKDEEGTTRKTVTSRYVPPPKNVASNNARQSLEGGAQFAEAGAEGGPALHISGEEKDGAGNTLRTFTAIERTQGGKTTLQTTYRRPDKEGLTETLTTEDGRLTQKEITYPDKEAAAKNIKTETITYEKSAAAMFYPARQELTRAVYRDAEGEETKRVETKSDKSTITTTPKWGGTLAVHKNPGGTETLRVETRKDGSTITTKTTAGGITKELVIHPSVTAIEDNAFRNSGLTSLTIGNSVQRIGDEAFKGNKLTSVSIPPSVTAIANYAFADNQLTKLTIPPSVTKIGYQAFATNKLTLVTLSQVLFEEMRGYAFDDNPAGLQFRDHAGRSLGTN